MCLFLLLLLLIPLHAPAQNLPTICLENGACYQGSYIMSLEHRYASFQGIRYAKAGSCHIPSRRLCKCFSYTCDFTVVSRIINFYNIIKGSVPILTCFMTLLLYINSWKLGFQVSWRFLVKLWTPYLFCKHHASWPLFSWKMAFQVSWRFFVEIWGPIYFVSIKNLDPLFIL